jgi:hypothetical protein
MYNDLEFGVQARSVSKCATDWPFNSTFSVDRYVQTLDYEVVQILAYILFSDVDEDYYDPDCSVVI